MSQQKKESAASCSNPNGQIRPSIGPLIFGGDYTDHSCAVEKNSALPSCGAADSAGSSSILPALADGGGRSVKPTGLWRRPCGLLGLTDRLERPGTGAACSEGEMQRDVIFQQALLISCASIDQQQRVSVGQRRIG